MVEMIGHSAPLTMLCRSPSTGLFPREHSVSFRSSLPMMLPQFRSVMLKASLNFWILDGSNFGTTLDITHLGHFFGVLAFSWLAGHLGFKWMGLPWCQEDAGGYGGGGWQLWLWSQGFIMVVSAARNGWDKINGFSFDPFEQFQCIEVLVSCLTCGSGMKGPWCTI